MTTHWCQVVPSSYYQEEGAEAASVSSPPVYPTPCLFLVSALLVAVTGDVEKELPASGWFSSPTRVKLASYEDKQTKLGEVESCRYLHLLNP